MGRWSEIWLGIVVRGRRSFPVESVRDAGIEIAIRVGNIGLFIGHFDMRLIGLLKNHFGSNRKGCEQRIPVIEFLVCRL